MPIVIDDLEISQELDRAAMANLWGGQLPNEAVLGEWFIRKEGMGTFIVGDQLMHRYRDVFIRVIQYTSNPYDQPFIGPISTWPVPGTGP